VFLSIRICEAINGHSDHMVHIGKEPAIIGATIMDLARSMKPVILCDPTRPTVLSIECRSRNNRTNRFGRIVNYVGDCSPYLAQESEGVAGPAL